MNKLLVLVGLLFFCGIISPLCAQSDSSSAKPKIDAPAAPPIRETSADINAPSINEGLTVPPNISPLDQPKRRRKKPIDSLASANATRFADSINPATAIGAPSSPVVGTVATVSTLNAHSDTTPVLSSSDNPLDILRGSQQINAKKDSAQHSVSSISPYLDKSTYSRNFNFWIFFLNFLLLSILISYGRKAVSSAFSSILSENILKQTFRDFIGKSSTKIAINGLYGIFLFNFSEFIFLYLKAKNTSLPLGQGTLFLYCLGVICLIFLVKHFLLFGISKIFPIEKEVRLYNFVILVTGILAGFCLFATNLFVAFLPPASANFFINVSIGILVLMYLLRYVRSISIIGKFVSENRFHFLLYICSVEIAPVVIFFKILSKYNFGL